MLRANIDELRLPVCLGLRRLRLQLIKFNIND